MKFIIFTAIFAFALSSAGDVTALAVSATFYNTTNKVSDSLCQLTVTATINVPFGTSGNNAIWLMNSKTQHSVIVNDTIIFVSMGFTVTGTTFSAPTATAGFYVANNAITIGSSTTVTSANAPSFGSLTTGSSTIASDGTSWATTFNTSYSQTQYLNASTASAG